MSDYFVNHRIKEGLKCACLWCAVAMVIRCEPHGRRKDRCVECGGKGICTHGRRKSECVDCGGKGICPHGRKKYRCPECIGTAMCPHGRRNDGCRKCKRPLPTEPPAEPASLPCPPGPTMCRELPDQGYIEAQAKQRTACLCTGTLMPLGASLYERVVPLALASRSSK